MAHNLNVVNGVVSMAYAAEKPWHGLGFKVPGLMKPTEALFAGGLDYKVTREPLHIKGQLNINNDGTISESPEIQVPMACATVRKARSDKEKDVILGIVGPDYQVVQNAEAFEPFNEIFGNDTACVETVGALGKGEIVWMMVKMPEIAEIVPGDPVERYLLITTSHDGSHALRALFNPVRTVCANTLSLALKSAKHIIAIKHSKNVKENMKEIKNLLGASDLYWQKSIEAFRYMASKQVNQEEVKEFLRKLFPGKKILDDGTEEVAQRTENMRSRIQVLFDGQAIGADLAGKTRWGLFQAVGHYIDHERDGRARKDGADVSKWQNSVLGLGFNLRQAAGDLLLV